MKRFAVVFLLAFLPGVALAGDMVTPAQGFAVTSPALDALLGATPGGVAVRGASGWVNTGSGVSGQALTSQGAGVAPIWSSITAATSSGWDVVLGNKATTSGHNPQVTPGDLLQFGGATNSFAALKPNGTTLALRLADDSGAASLSFGPSTLTAAGQVALGASNGVAWSGRSLIQSLADGDVLLTNNAVGSFGKLQLGGTSNLFPAVKRNSAALNFRLADDSADASITAGDGTFTGSGTNQKAFLSTPTASSGLPSGIGGSICLGRPSDAGITFFWAATPNGGSAQECGIYGQGGTPGTAAASRLRLGGDGGTAIYSGQSLASMFGNARGNAGWLFSSDGNTLALNSAGVVGWSSSADAGGTVDTVLLRDAANVLAHRNGTNAQAARFYNTFTSATSFERFNIDAQTTANVFQLYNSVGSAGGTPRQLVLGGWTQVTDAAGQALLVRGDSAYAQSTVNTNAQGVGIFGGVARKVYILLNATNLSGKTFTITVVSPALVPTNVTLTDGTDFTHSNVNNTEAANLAAAINANGTLSVSLTAVAVAANVYLTCNANVPFCFIATNAAVGDATANNANDGTVSIGWGNAGGNAVMTVSSGGDVNFGGPSATSLLHTSNGWGLDNTGLRLRNSSGFLISSTISYSGASDIQLYRQNAAGILGLLQNTSGGAAQLRVYGTTDSTTTPANADWLEITTVAGGAKTIGTNKAGTGTAGELDLSANGSLGLRILTSGQVQTQNNLYITTGNGVYWRSGTGSGIQCAADGQLQIANNAFNGLTSLTLGGDASGADQAANTPILIVGAGTGAGANGTLRLQAAPAISGGGSSSAVNAQTTLATFAAVQNNLASAAFSNGAVATLGNVTFADGGTGSTGNYCGLLVSPTVNWTGTGAKVFTGLVVNQTQTSVTGATATNLMDLQLAGVSKFNVSSTGTVVLQGAITTNGNVIVPNANAFGFSSRGYIQAASDGVFSFQNSTVNGFTRLQFGGTSSSFVAVQTSGTTLTIGTADGGTSAGALAVSGTTTHTGDILFASNGTVSMGAASSGIKKLFADYTNTATVGNVTINKASGRVIMAAATSTFTVTNSLVTAASHVMVTISSAPGNALGVSVWTVPAAGSFTINTSANLTNQTTFDYFVVGAD